MAKFTGVGYDIAGEHLPGCCRAVWDLWLTFERAPTGAYPNHTRFMVLTCDSCKGVQLFPPANVALVTPEFRARFLAFLAANGWHVRQVEKRR